MRRRTLVLGILALALMLFAATPAFASTTGGKITAAVKVSGGYRFTLKASNGVSASYFSYAPKSKFIYRANLDVNGRVESHSWVSPATMWSNVLYNLGFKHQPTASFVFHRNARGYRILDKGTKYAAIFE